MIKTNEYYATVYGRTNKLKNGLLSFFFGISSMPRLLAEVFLRRDLGRQYFSLFHCVIWAILLLVLPFILPSDYNHSWYQPILKHWGWYLFLLAFCKFSWKRHKECKRPWGYFDFNHFSKSSGKRLPQVENFKFLGKPVNVRAMDVYVEPLLITAVGLFSLLVGQWMLGTLLTICAGIYSLSYRAAYQTGRNSSLEDIDRDIANRWITNTFLNDQPQTSNFNFYGPKPSSSEVRKGFADLLGKEDEGTEVK